VVGLMIQAGFSLVSVKLLLIMVFVFFTSPMTTHALARACLNGGIRPAARDRSANGDVSSKA
jgi:multicomponent Na+:H+ antiporter subunit G